MLHPTVDEDGNIEEVACGDAVFHFIAVFWKVVYSLNPPPHYGGGWPAFFGALFFIGLTTLIVAEIANLMGCVLGILPGVTAITFVAIGTSIPDTFASKIAAQQERYADEAVGNVTGSNSVNVFLGLGLPWIIATSYGHATGTTY
jgi:solute carrier family 8 (sodium/calcium exchanger)